MGKNNKNLVLIQSPTVWNPFNKGYFENPHKQLSVLREQNPVHKGVNGNWVFFGYKDVKYLLKSPVFQTIKLNKQLESKNRFLSNSEDLNSVSTAVSKWLFFLDPPDHSELRSLVVKNWNHFQVQDLIEEVVAESLERISNKREVEIIDDFAEFIPTKIICKILGLPFEDYKQLRHWAKYFAKTLEPFASLYNLVEYNQNAKEFYQYMEKVIHLKLQEPDDYFISNFLISNKQLEKPLNQSELISIFIILFFAGIETSIYLFGQSVFHLINNPEQLSNLQKGVIKMSRATEELIRFASPLQYAPRIVTEDIEIGGKKIMSGEMVFGCVASANRDPEIFEQPERLILDRKTNPHISFGHGFHHCIGAKLARDEMNTALPKFINLFKKIEFHPNKKFEWEKIIINRGLKSLPVVLST